MADDALAVRKARIGEIREEPRLPGHETQREPGPEWLPRCPGTVVNG